MYYMHIKVLKGNSIMLSTIYTREGRGGCVEGAKLQDVSTSSIKCLKCKSCNGPPWRIGSVFDYRLKGCTLG